METSLLDLYDNLKGRSSPAAPPVRLKMGPMQVGNFRHQCRVMGDDLKERCGKHILLDIYCKILPLDKDYVDTHQGQMSSDVSAMLNQKGMSPTEYLTSAYEKTKAPLLEYVLRCIDTIRDQYIVETEDQLQDAMDGNAPETPPAAPSVDEEPVNSQIVDLKNDMEYQQFIDILKKKTVDKIVNDVSDLINSKKEENDMEFNTSGGQDDFGSLDDTDSDISLEGEGEGSEETPPAAPEEPAEGQEGNENNGEEPPEPNEDFSASESAVAVGLEYLSKKLWNYKFTEAGKDEALGLAVREATLYQLDKVFAQKTFLEFSSGVYFGKGYVINERAIQRLVDPFMEDLGAGSIADIKAGVDWISGWGKKKADDVFKLIEKMDDKVNRILNYVERIRDRQMEFRSYNEGNDGAGSIADLKAGVDSIQGWGKKTAHDAYELVEKFDDKINRILKWVEDIKDRMSEYRESANTISSRHRFVIPLKEDTGNVADIKATTDWIKNWGKKTADDLFKVLEKIDEKIDRILKYVEDIRDKIRAGTRSYSESDNYGGTIADIKATADWVSSWGKKTADDAYKLTEKMDAKIDRILEYVEDIKDRQMDYLRSVKKRKEEKKKESEKKE